jgi:hypothetical protein
MGSQRPVEAMRRPLESVRVFCHCAKWVLIETHARIGRFRAIDVSMYQFEIGRSTSVAVGSVRIVPVKYVACNVYN